MPQYYGTAGISEYDFSQGSSTVTSFSIDLDTNATVSMVTAEWAYTTEGSSNAYGLLRARNSSNSLLDVSYRTWGVSTTSTLSVNNTDQTYLNIITLGVANNTSFTGEHFRAKMIIINHLNTSLPMAHPTVYGEVSHEGTSGDIYNVNFNFRVVDTEKISNLLFVPTGGSVRWYRANSWSIAD